MRLIPTNTINGAMDLYGSSLGTWRSLLDLMTDAGKSQPEGTNALRIYCWTDLSFCMAPDAVAASPGIAPIVVKTGNTLELFDAEQMRQFRLLDNGPYMTLQFYRAA